MIEASQFCDHFWGQQGFDVLYQNMKSGLKTSTEFLDFLREIYTMEDSCTKSWLKLSKQLNINTSGSLQPFWSSLKELSEKRSSVHMEVGHGLQIVIKSLQKYIEEQQMKQKTNKDIDLQTQNFSNMLLTTAGQLMRAKETYHNKYAEFHKISTSDMNPSTKAREVEKIESKLKKAVDEYKYLIEKYNNTCVKFKSKMNDSCKTFQEIEKCHLEQMRDFITRFSQSLFKAQHEFSEQERDFCNNQEKLTVDYLLDSFIKLKSTGKTPPEMMRFEEVETNSSDNLSKESAEICNELVLNGHMPNDVATGNLVNIDSWSDVSSTRVSNMNLSTQPMKDSINDIFDGLSSVSDNNSTNHNINISSESNTVKKQKKYNHIFRRRRNSPSYTEKNKSSQDLDKEKSTQSLGDFLVDEEGFSIKPQEIWNEDNNNSDSDSSSGEDQGENTFKGIKIEIKPQETKSNSSSTPDMESTVKVSTVEDLDLLKAVQAIKLVQPTNKEKSRRTSETKLQTLSLLKEKKERDPSQCHSEKDFGQVSNRESRRKRTNSQSEQFPKISQPSFSIDFEKSFEGNGLDAFDQFCSKFDAFSKAKNQNPIQSDTDPWGCKPHDDHCEPPPLPAKISPPRAASALPFNHQKLSEPFRPFVPPVTTRIPPPPNRANVNPVEGFPLAIAFTETVNAKFRELFNTTPQDVHTNGQLVISFPCSMVQQLESLGEAQLSAIEPIHFTLTNATRLRNVETNNKDIVTRIENPAEDTFSIFLDLLSLHRRLTSLRRKEPSLPFFNIEVIKYDVTNSVRPNGSINAPVYISASWQFADPSTSHLIINYNFKWPNTNVASLTFKPNAAIDVDPEIQPRGEVRFLVSADGGPQKMQSLPPCVWNSDLGRASWRLDLSAGRSSIKSKFVLGEGPGTPQPVICQFSAEGSIESGVMLQVAGSRFRISRHKYRLISGRYLWEPSPVPGGFSTSAQVV